MKRWHTLFVVAWSIFGISFFLPVHRDGHTLADGVLPGWEAMSGALRGWAGLFGITSGLTNLLMVATLLVLWVRRRRFVVTLQALVAAATLLNAYWFVAAEPREHLLIGYYLWWASFGVVTGGLFLLARGLVTGADNSVPVAA